MTKTELYELPNEVKQAAFAALPSATKAWDYDAKLNCNCEGCRKYFKELEVGLSLASPSTSTSTSSCKTNAVLPRRIESELYGTGYYGAMTPEVYGGKACSLGRLRDMGLHVPPAWVLTCEHTFTRPEIALPSEVVASYEYYGYKFAVRSGAPVSMPGMMDTELAVAPKDIPAAVNRVWDSYFSERATAYREQHGLDHKMGTAVIIQRMVTPKYAGVAFTSDPANPKSKEFNPIVEYLEDQTGDALVGGKSTPKRAEYPDPVLLKLADTLYSVHSQQGPSDLEWVIDTSGKLWYVQHRALKFPPVTAPTSKINSEVLASGLSIGAHAQTIGKVVTDPKQAPGNILYLNQFQPENYQLMLQAIAILCEAGGETCHAAIVAREMGKVAISGIGLSAALTLRDKTVLVDGTTGKIHVPQAGAQINEPPVIKGINRRYDPIRKPDFSLRQRNYSASAFLVRFYENMWKARKGLISEERKEKVAEEIARVFCTYFYISCVGEARHARKYSEASPTRRLLLDALARNGVRLPKRGSNISTDRDVFATQNLQEPKSLRHAIKVMTLVHRIFTTCQWSSSFGGVAWGRIAHLVLQYLQGNLSHTLFVDACFNLKHNGGCAFGKFTWMHGEGVGMLLDAKATAGHPGTIYAFCAMKHPYLRREFDNVTWPKYPFSLKEYSAADTIFPELNT
jgi:pyruvate,orthophosphate dikinase